MPCPFPGMDPFLEQPPFWGDFAPRLLASIANVLLPEILPAYDARIEEYLFLCNEDDERLHRVEPDVTISSIAPWSGLRTGAGVAVAEPLAEAAEALTSELEYPALEPAKQRRLTLIHRLSGRVVTVIELLSPSNKTPGRDGLDAYRTKRAELLASDCHVIEIDLLRGGRRLPMTGNLPRGDYFAYVGRTERRPRCEAIGWSWRAPLPRIPVPLLPNDPDVALDLAAAFRAAYEPSLYDRRLPYDQPLVPRLPPEEELWVRDRLASWTSQ